MVTDSGFLLLTIAWCSTRFDDIEPPDYNMAIVLRAIARLISLFNKRLPFDVALFKTKGICLKVGHEVPSI